MILVLTTCVVAACGNGSDRPEDLAQRNTWVASFPEVGPATLDELADVLKAPPELQPVTLDIDELPAAVFCLGCESPNVDHDEWQDLIERLCGPDQLAQLAIDEGWKIHITGYVDDAGPHGPGTENERLPLARAETSAMAIQDSCSIPATSIQTFDGGISNNNIRKIVVAFHRPSTEQEPSSP